MVALCTEARTVLRCVIMGISTKDPLSLILSTDILTHPLHSAITMMVSLRREVV